MMVIGVQMDNDDVDDDDRTRCWFVACVVVGVGVVAWSLEGRRGPAGHPQFRTETDAGEGRREASRQRVCRAAVHELW